MHSLRMSLARGARSDFSSASEALAARVPPGVAMRPLMTAVGAATGAAAGSAAGSGARDASFGAQPAEVVPEPSVMPVMAAAKSFLASLSAVAQRHSTLCGAATALSAPPFAPLTPGRGGPLSLVAVASGMAVSGVAVWAWMTWANRRAQAERKPNLEFATGERIICLSSNTEEANRIDPVAYLHVGSCVVCFSSPCDIVLNCGHMCMCGDCAKLCTKCPACATDISRRLRVRECNRTD